MQTIQKSTQGSGGQQSQPPTIHSTNPQINALVTSFINTENQLNQQRQQQQQAQAQAAAQAQQNAAAAAAAAAAKSSNAAIINLLNSTPAPMTSSAVASAGCGLTLASPQESIVKRTTENPVKSGGGGAGSATVLQQQLIPNRILNHANLIAVSPVNMNTGTGKS